MPKAKIGPKAKIELLGPLVFGGSVSYALKDRRSCDYTGFFSNYGDPLRLGESLIEPINAEEPIVVEYEYHFRPGIGCFVAAEFTPKAGATYRLLFDEIGFLENRSCEPKVMILNEVQKKYVDSPFQKACGRIGVPRPPDPNSPRPEERLQYRWYSELIVMKDNLDRREPQGALREHIKDRLYAAAAELPTGTIAQRYLDFDYGPVQREVLGGVRATMNGDIEGRAYEIAKKKHHPVLARLPNSRRGPTATTFAICVAANGEPWRLAAKGHLHTSRKDERYDFEFLSAPATFTWSSTRNPDGSRTYSSPGWLLPLFDSQSVVPDERAPETVTVPFGGGDAQSGRGNRQGFQVARIYEFLGATALVVAPGEECPTR